MPCSGGPACRASGQCRAGLGELIHPVVVGIGLGVGQVVVCRSRVDLQQGIGEQRSRERQRSVEPQPLPGVKPGADPCVAGVPSSSAPASTAHMSSAVSTGRRPDARLVGGGFPPASMLVIALPLRRACACASACTGCSCGLVTGGVDVAGGAHLVCTSPPYRSKSVNRVPDMSLLLESAGRCSAQ